MNMVASTDSSACAGQDELVRTARALAHAVNNRLVLPLGLLDLLEARAEISAELRPLFGPARESLQEMAMDVLQLELQRRDVREGRAACLPHRSRQPRSRASSSAWVRSSAFIAA